jgi:hypothetical protein
MTTYHGIIYENITKIISLFPISNADRTNVMVPFKQQQKMKIGLKCFDTLVTHIANVMKCHFRHVLRENAD